MRHVVLAFALLTACSNTTTTNAHDVGASVMLDGGTTWHRCMDCAPSCAQGTAAPTCVTTSGALCMDSTGAPCVAVCTEPTFNASGMTCTDAGPGGVCLNGTSTIECWGTH